MNHTNDDNPDITPAMDNNNGDDDVNDIDEPDIQEPEDEIDADEDTRTEEESALPLQSVVEAILFAARAPLRDQQIARCVGRGTRRDKVREAIKNLNNLYQESGRAFEIVSVNERFQLMSRPEYALHIQKLFPRKEENRKFSPASLDTLSIIAYKQPITRVEVEAIRGVSCGPVLRTLIERGLVRVVGKQMDIVGHPWLYGTTSLFLTEFGLDSLEQLPMVHELRRATGTQEDLPEPGQESLPADPGTEEGQPEIDAGLTAQDDGDPDEDIDDPDEDYDDEEEYDEEYDDDDDDDEEEEEEDK